MSQKSVKFHIESGDYFGTLATILSLLQQNISAPKYLKEMGILNEKIDELLYLQNNYLIKKKFNKKVNSKNQ